MTDSDFRQPPPVDLSPLDPTRDAKALDARVRAIMASAVIRPRRDVFADLARWFTPSLVAASILIAIASVALLRNAGPARPISTTEALGIPRSVIELARSGSSPGVVELSEALGVERAYAR